MLFRLSDDDRARLGLTLEQEWVDWDLRRVVVAEAIILQRAPEHVPGLGLERYDSPTALREALGAEPTNYQAWATAAWLALRHAGATVSYADAMTFDVVGLTWKHNQEEQALIDAALQTEREAKDVTEDVATEVDGEGKDAGARPPSTRSRTSRTSPSNGSRSSAMSTRASAGGTKSTGSRTRPS